MQRTVWEKATEPPNDGVGLLLKPEYFEALMIEAIDGILVAPMAARIVKQCLQAPAAGLSGGGSVLIQQSGRSSTVSRRNLR